MSSRGCPAAPWAAASGRAVEALSQVPVSYAPAASVSELEGDGFLRLPGVGEGIVVAAMPAAALREIGGGPSAVARETAREAGVDGTIVVLAGQRLGAWSEDVPAARLAVLVRAAERTGDHPAVRVADLVA